jgi:hypothetical protein
MNMHVSIWWACQQVLSTAQGPTRHGESATAIADEYACDHMVDSMAASDINS